MVDLRSILTKSKLFYEYKIQIDNNEFSPILCLGSLADNSW